MAAAKQDLGWRTVRHASSRLAEKRKSPARGRAL
jgi:hypothetical protein